MRFAVPISEEEGLVSEDFSDTSEEEEPLDNGKGRPPPRSSLGQIIRASIDTSGSEPDSEDEVDLLGGGWGDGKPPGRGPRRTPSLSSRRIISNRSLGAIKTRPEDASKYEAWLTACESAAMREGQRIALGRRDQLRDLARRARAEVRKEAEMRAGREEEEVRRMLEGMALRQKNDEEETAVRFEARKQRLWADIESAIREVEEREEGIRVAAQAVMRKQAEEEAGAARRAEEERRKGEEAAAQKRREQKAGDERRDREAKEGQREREARAGEERKAAAERKAKEERQKAKASGGMAGAEWRKWVELQKTIKLSIIEVAKADRALKAPRRLVTRGLGQVVNTREAGLRVANDIHRILCESEDSPVSPSASKPIRLDQPPPIKYAYLLSHTAKALIKQAESEVSAKSDAAFPLARIIILLLLRGHSAFGEILFARFVKKCPWVVPFYPGRQPNQPRDEYEKSTGRGVDESVADYISRMAGIVTLYLAVLQTPLRPLVSTLPSPPTHQQLKDLIPAVFRFPASWSWLAFALRDPLPALPPTAHLVGVWLEIVGAEAVRLYGIGQVTKAFDALLREGLEGGKLKGDSEAARQRLGLMLAGGTDGLNPHPAREWT